MSDQGSDDDQRRDALLLRLFRLLGAPAMDPAADRPGYVVSRSPWRSGGQNRGRVMTDWRMSCNENWWAVTCGYFVCVY
jgi:hypothetical protein